MTDHPLWVYSLQVYADSRVRKYCLDLQHRYDADVNLVLFCCWLGRCGTALTEQMLAELVERVRPVRETEILVLRRDRQRLSARGPGEQAQREWLLERELQAEAREQDLLYEWWRSQPPAPPGKGAPLDTNLAAYFRLLDIGESRRRELLENCPAPLWLDN